jgi:hypothetical protein
MLCVAFSYFYAECNIFYFVIVMLNVIMLSVAFSYCYAECHYGVCCIFLIFMLSVVFSILLLLC